MKNDLSFLIDSSMNLYEHQSTENPNMPLRGLLYFAQLYDKYITKHQLNLFSATADMENRRTAITRTIDECIAEGILADILTEQKAEVLELEKQLEQLKQTK